MNKSVITVIAASALLSKLRRGSSNQDFTEITSTEDLFKALGCTMDARKDTKKIIIPECLSDQSATLVLQAVTMFPNIEELYINNPGPDDDLIETRDAYSFPKGAKLSSSLKIVKLYGIWIADLSMFEDCKQLQYLEINGGIPFVYDEPRDYHISNDFSGIRNLPKLKKLDITTYPVNIKSLVEGVTNHPSLKEIYGEVTWFSREDVPMSFFLDAEFEWIFSDDSVNISMNNEEFVRALSGDFKNDNNKTFFSEELNHRNDPEFGNYTFKIIDYTDGIRRF